MSDWVKHFIAILSVACCVAIPATPAGTDGLPEGNCVIRGSVMTEFGHRNVPVRKVSVYLFTLEQSRSLQGLQRKARERRDQPGLREAEKGEMLMTYLDSATELVPHLTRTALVKTDKSGSYRFDKVSAGRQYQVVVATVQEDGVIFVQRVTPVLKPGDILRLDMNESRDNDWTDLTPAPR